MKPKRIIHLFFGAILVILAGCGGIFGGGASTQTVLEESTAHMSSLDGYQFQLSHTGPPAYVDTEGTAKFVKASGHFVSPDKVNAKIKVSMQNIVVEISVISLGDQQWASNPLTGAYQKVEENFTYRPAVFFDPESGFFATLGEEITDVTLVGEEELEEMPGLKLQHLSGSLPGEVVSDISYGMIKVDAIEVDLWIDSEAGEIHRVELADPTTAEEEEPSAWKFDFWNFGETIEIEAPEG